ncbi:MAG: RpiB/LacA/LacB family sugar-phosphate isomerase [Bacteroidales bacterium]|jgi:RpiB/LacA/LacB family sugar-phosphate isomerase|nr:RpiB/LacA/LacB family sugar-phosphate isomerase [Bacteroidales bacterium]
MSETGNKTIDNNLKLSRIILPTVLGLGIIAWFLIRDFDKLDFSVLHFSVASIGFIFIAFLMMIFRDLGYMIRLRILSSNQLSWIKCFRIIMLWEFSSAITPSAVGGTALATIFIWKEGLSVGKSTSIVIATSFLDELYFSIMFPLMFLFFSRIELFNIGNSNTFTNQFFYFAITGYSLKLAWTVLMGYSIFLNPGFFAKLVRKIFKIRFLKRWLPAAEKMSKDFEISNVELKNKSFKFWFKSTIATFLSWTSRYWVLNFLLLAFIFALGTNSSEYLLSAYDHLLIFARQLIMWIMMLVMPTPGGSGFVETIFTSYMADFVPVAGFVILMVLVWRLITYYPYLIIGAIIAPKWINKNFKKKKMKTIGFACDHAGFELKQFLMDYLKSKNYEVKDYGAYSAERSDYPDYAHPLAEAVENRTCDLGFSLCGSGNGINMTVNKHQQIRGALCWNEEISELARRHNDANICALPARFITEEEAVKIVDIFLNTEFEAGRHIERINKIPLNLSCKD